MKKTIYLVIVICPYFYAQFTICKNYIYMCWYTPTQPVSSHIMRLFHMHLGEAWNHYVSLCMMQYISYGQEDSLGTHSPSHMIQPSESRGIDGQPFSGADSGNLLKFKTPSFMKLSYIKLYFLMSVRSICAVTMEPAETWQNYVIITPE